MVKATWNGAVIAESDKTERVEGNHYFPPDSVKQEYLKDSAKTTVCGWKGTSNYKSIVVDGKVNEDAAWYYATPKAAAENIKGYYAFWKGVQVS